MSIDREIMRVAAQEIAFVDGVYQVNAEAKEGDAALYIDIDLDDGSTMRLTLEEAPE